MIRIMLCIDEDGDAREVGEGLTEWAVAREIEGFGGSLEVRKETAAQLVT